MEIFDNKVYNNMDGMTEDHLLRIQKDEFSTVTVVNQHGVAYSHGDLVNHEDVLTITATFVDNYEKKYLKLNGVDFTSGDEHEVAGAILIEIASRGEAYDLARTATNGNVVVTRNGIAVEDGADAVRYGEKLTIIANIEDGYELASLEVNNEAIESGEVFVVGAENVSIEMVGAIITYNITYNLDGGENNEANPSTYTITTPTITLEPATKDYHTFNGWYTNEEFTGDSVSEIEVGSFGNITLYAKLDANEYTITYMDGETEIEGLSPATYTFGSITPLPLEAEKEDYTFDGWYDNAELSGDVVVSIGAEAHGNKTFYAKFTLSE